MPAPIARQRVLLVDDDVDVLEVLGPILAAWGHQVRTAADGGGAVEVAAAFAPEVVLLDISLPDLDGYEVARRLRALPGGERIQIVALTGYGQATDRQRSRDAGFALHLSKPFELDELAPVLGPRPARGGGRP